MAASLPLIGGARVEERVAVGLVCLAEQDRQWKAEHFWLNFAMEDKGWMQGEPYSTSDVFTSKQGRFTARRRSISLLADDGRRVAEIRDLDLRAVQEDDKGEMGFAVETGRPFSWTVAIVMR